MLKAAKRRTRFLNSKIQNNYFSPSPVHDFDHRTAEIAARNLQAFTSKIAATRARRSPIPSIPNDEQDTLDENMKNENKEIEINERESPLDDIINPIPSAKLINDTTTGIPSNPEPHIPDQSPSPELTSTKPVDYFKPLSPEPRLNSPPKPSEPRKSTSPDSVEDFPNQNYKETRTSDDATPNEASSPSQDSQKSVSFSTPYSSETEAESGIDEENYDQTTDDEKGNSLPRPKSEANENFIPLRKRQLIPLPHFGGVSPAQLGKSNVFYYCPVLSTLQ
jgi:hypothetical protein